MNIYNGYCYGSMSQITDLIQSEQVQVSGSSFVYSQLVTLSGNTATFSTPIGNYTRTFIECLTEGPLLTQTHMTTFDAVTLGWSIIAVWVVAWGFKALRRTF